MFLSIVPLIQLNVASTPSSKDLSGLISVIASINSAPKPEDTQSVELVAKYFALISTKKCCCNGTVSS